ncbi:MAG: hypothetical protein HUU17_09120 [Chthonomonadales bacterium]|nr:hypothetical protein [Chthonomonadales bacterium]
MSVFNGFTFVILLMGIIFSVPIIAIITEHRRKLLELKMKAGSSAELDSGMRGLSKEIADLRETATQYDISFDAALERLEARVVGMEKRIDRLERLSGQQSEAEVNVMGDMP